MFIAFGPALAAGLAIISAALLGFRAGRRTERRRQNPLVQLPPAGGNANLYRRVSEVITGYHDDLRLANEKVKILETEIERFQKQKHDDDWTVSELKLDVAVLEEDLDEAAAKYKILADDAASLRARAETAEIALAKERSANQSVGFTLAASSGDLATGGCSNLQWYTTTSDATNDLFID